jgi:hypothetical protein
MYLNYAREHWMKAGENPPVGLILCAEKGSAEAHYALDNLSNRVLAARIPDCSARRGLRGKNLKDTDSRPRMIIEGY